MDYTDDLRVVYKVEVPHPPKQGLKPEGFIGGFGVSGGRSASSTKTRIETSRPGKACVPLPRSKCLIHQNKD